MVMFIGSIVYWFMSILFAKIEQPSPYKFICSFQTSERREISKVKVVSATRKRKAQAVEYGTVEMDTHADTIVFGRNFVQLQATGRECSVSPYSDAYEAIHSVPIVSAATAWTSPRTTETYILVFHEGLWMGETMDHSLVNPNQMRAYGVTVQENPFSTSPLYLQAPDDDFVIPLQTKGTNVIMETRSPTDEELQNCRQIELSLPQYWDPHTVRFPNATRSVEEEITELHHERKRITSSLSTLTPSLEEIDDSDSDNDSANGCPEIFDLDRMQQRLISGVRASEAPPLRTVSSTRQQDVPIVPTFQSKSRHSDVTASDLSERWCISLFQATETLKRTTQRFVRSAILPLSRRYRADRMFELPRLRGDWFTDTLDGRVKSKDGNKHAQVFANKSYFASVFPMETKGQAGEALSTFCKTFGVPDRLIFDGSREQNGKNTKFMKTIRKYGMDHHTIEPERHNQNPCEGVIRELRKKWFRIMVRKRVPRRFWDYGMRWVSETMQLTANKAGRMDTAIPLEVVSGETPDISEYLDFGFYDKVSYRENAGLGETKHGRWLGVSHKTGSLMCYWVLTAQCTVISRTSVQRVTSLELQTDEQKERFKEFDAGIKLRLNEDELPLDGDKAKPEDWAAYVGYDKDFNDEFNFVVSDDGVKDADENFTPDVFDDTYLNMELALPKDGDENHFAKVTKRLRDANGLPIGVADDNPMLDTRIYEVEYLDGHKASLTANTIAQNLFAQVDKEGNRHVLMDEIIDHRVDGTEVKQIDAFVTTSSGTKRRRQTTKGWEHLVRWKDGSTLWVALKDLKQSNPVEVAEYAVGAKLSGEPAFAWWTHWVLKKRNRIVGKVKTKYWIRTHKFGFKIPKNVQEAKDFDRENGNTLWWDAICKEMKNVRVAFEVFEGTEADIPIGYQKVDCHLIFDIKMGENFRRKARQVAGGHKTEAPASITYSSVVSRDSVRIALTIAALNGLEVLACDIQNAYLTAPCREKIWTKAGPEFGSECGQLMLITRALYGLKSSGAAFRAFLAETLHELGYVPSKADPDVWMRPAVKPDGFEYYEYVLCYVDDILSISHDPKRTMNGIQEKFKLKDDKIEEPSDYLGAGLEKMVNDNGTECWTMTSQKYTKAAVENVEEHLAKSGTKLPNRCGAPLSSGYKPEIDATAELKADGVQYYQELIGVLRWAIELGRVDLLLEVSLMSAYSAMPRAGQLEQLYHIFGYLKENPKRKIAFDPDHPKVDERRFEQYDWYDFYRGVKEAIPGDMPKPRGNYMSTHCFVDANNAGNVVTRRSQTGILLFCNRAPIVWHSKRQNTVEVSTFGSELVAMKNAVELIEALRYKLRMFGIPVDGPTNIYCDNESVVKNCSRPESMLNKKHHSIAYHRCREAVAAGTCRVTKEHTSTNLSDLFTKMLPAAVREALLDLFTY